MKLRIDAPLALGLALITSARLLTGCAWLQAHERDIEQIGCDLAQLDTGDPALAAWACAVPGTKTPSPECEAVVRQELRALPPAPSETRARLIKGRGMILDQRAVSAAAVLDAGMGR
jgi:hypothetical protein